MQSTVQPNRAAMKARPAPPALPGEAAARAFWTGFTEPSRLGLTMTAAGFAVMLAVALWFFSIPTLSGPLGKYLPRSERDSEGFATQLALHLHQTPQRHPRLLILGSSATANAIAAEEPLARELRERTGMDWEVHMLTTPLQSLLEQMALIEVALGPENEDRLPTVVAVGVSMSRQAWTRETLLNLDREGRIGIRSTWADDEVRALGGEPRQRTGFYVADNYHFVFANGCESLLRLLTGLPARRRIDAFAPPKPIPVEKRLRDLVAAKIQNGLKDNSAFVQVMDSLRRHIAGRRNVRLVQIEEAISPGLLQSRNLESAQAAVAARFTADGERTGTPYLPIISDAALDDSAYNDDLHIADPGAQARVRSALAARIAGLVQQGFLK